MWGNPKERERERSYYSASGKYISAAKSQFPGREIQLQHTKNSPKNLPRNLCQVRTIVRPSQKIVPQNP
jgi:hypothetical protein